MSRMPYLSLVLVALCLNQAFAVVPPHQKALANLDKRAALPPAALAGRPGLADAVAQLRTSVPDVQVDLHPVLGSPKYLGSRDGFLTGAVRNAERNAVPGGKAAAAAESAQLVGRFLEANRGLFGHGSEVLADAVVRRDFVTSDTGLRTTVWAQQVQGLDVLDAVLIGHVTRAGELVNLSSQFLPAPGLAAVNGMGGEGVAQPLLEPAAAVAQAARDLGAKADSGQLVPKAGVTEVSRRQSWSGGPIKGEAGCRLLWLPTGRERMRLCWEVELTVRERPELYRILIDAQTSEVWLRRCLTTYLEDATYRVFTSDSPSPFSPGHVVPSIVQPALVSRELVTFAALSTNASPGGWINSGINETRGNNVDAHTDRNDDDVPDLPRPRGTPSRVFDFPLDLTQSPTNSSAAAVVQLFFWNNWMHDKLYELGFTEAAGNFQADNFGRGGESGDAVQADAQDGGGFNNARFTTPSDGHAPRMQMYLWDGPSPDRDGDFDAEVILHEYAHGLTQRRVGGGVGISALQSAGLGEGWSDFYALSLLSETSDDVDASYAIGGYLTYELSGLQASYYYGIRRYPCSTRLDRNPLTFKDIDPGQASSHPGVPRSPVFGGSPADEVHAQGEVWCVTLWEVRARLVRRHGPGAGNQLALQLVTDGLNLSPPDPTFLQARDAIIQADLVRTGGANREELWGAFARRGMGFSALVPPSDRTGGLEESFDLPDILSIQPVTGLTGSGEVGGPFAPSTTSYTLANAGTNDFTWSALKGASWYDLSAIQGTLVAGGATDSVTVTVNSRADSLPKGIYTDLLTFTNHLTRRTQVRRMTLRVGQPDYLTELFETDNDLAHQVFLFTPDASTSFYRVCRESAAAFPTDPAGGLQLMLTDDGFQQMDLADGRSVSLFGKSYTRVFVSANGFLTFEGGFSDYTESFSAHFSTPRVSALFDDFNPEEGGSIVWQQLADRIVVTWLEVPQFLMGDRNSFQLEMYYDGRIRVTYLDLGATGGLVGLSRGEGVADGFQASSFASYGPCVEPLVLLLPAAITEGAASVLGQLSLSEPPSSNIVVTLTSSDPNQVTAPASATVPAGTNRVAFTLTVANDNLLNGTRLVRISASASGFGTHAVSLAVDDDEHANLTLALPARATEGDGILSGAGQVTLDQVPDADIAVSLISSDPAKLQAPSVVIVPAGASRATFDLNILDDLRIDGTRSVPVVATVRNWGGGAAAMSIEDNENLDLAVSLPGRISEGNGVLKGAGSVRISGTLMTNLVVGLTCSDLTELVVPAEVIVMAGQTIVSFDLMAPDDSEEDWIQAVGVTATAPGFNPGTAPTVVYDNEVPPIPSNPIPADLATNVSPSIDLAWSAGEGDLIVNGGFETGDLTGWRTESTGDGSFVINDGTLDPVGSDGPLPPLAGRFSALSQQTDSGRRVLFQLVAIPPGANTALLAWTHRIRNQSSLFEDPAQEFRVEVRGAGGTTLEVLFSSNPGDPLLQDGSEHTVDVSRYIGRAIEIAFVEEDSMGSLNIHLDDVRLTLGSPSEPTWFDVYLGQTPELSEEQKLGTTTSPFWNLPRLDIDRGYFWQVVARRGSARVPSPVWQFHVPGVGPIDRFAWDPIPSPQILGLSFPVAVTAQDVFENTVSDFTGPLTLSGRAHQPDRIVGHGTNLWDFPLGTSYHDSRMQMILHASEVGPARLITSVTFDVGTPPGQVLQGFTVRMKHTALGGYGLNPVWESTGWTTVLQTTLSVDNAGPLVLRLTTPFDYNGLDHVMLDISFNNTSSSEDGPCRAWTAPQNRSITFRSDSEHGDPLQWTGTSPVPRASASVLNLRLSSEVAVILAPTSASLFTNGVWRGQATVDSQASHITLRAADAQGHFGQSNPFYVSLENDLSLFTTVGTNPAPVGDPFIYTLAITNVGPDVSHGIFLTNTLPDQATFVSATSSQGTVEQRGNLVVATIGELAGGAVATVTIVVIPTAQNSITNRAHVARVEADPDPANNDTVTITPVIWPQLAVGDVSVIEGNNGTVNAVFPVTLSFAATRPVAVDYATVDGTALAGSDYMATNGRFTFPPGVTVGTITVPIVPDPRFEAIEWFTLRLSNPTNLTLERTEIRGQILNDDPPPVLSIADVTVVEGNVGTVPASFEVTLSEPCSQVVSVTFATAGGSASSGSDFSPTTARVNFAPGTTNQWVTVSVNGDASVEADERFFVNLNSPTNATIGRSQGAGTIVNDDGIPGQVNGFIWSQFPSTQYAGVPFFVTLTARDYFWTLLPQFEGEAILSARRASADTTIGTGTGYWEYPLNASWHDARLQTIYLASELGGARMITALAINVPTLPGQVLNNWTLRMRHTSLASYGIAPAWENSGWTTVYRTNQAFRTAGWNVFTLTTPFEFNGTNNLMIDFSYNNSVWSTDGNCRSSSTTPRRSLFFHSDSEHGDPTTWSGTNDPAPEVATRIVNIRLTSNARIQVTPSLAGPFVGGVWTGAITVPQPATGVVLRAEDPTGRISNANAITVVQFVDGDGDGLPTSWEQDYLLDPANAADALADRDHDGLSNLDEFRAGTDPGLAASSLRISSVESSNGITRIRFPSVLAKGYRVEWADDVPSATWTALVELLAGTGEVLEVRDTPPAGSAARFYRIRLMP